MISTRSNPGERGLFRLFVGAALAHAGWKAFWKWALPKPKRLVTKVHLISDLVLKESYAQAIMTQLNMRRPLLYDLFYKPPSIEDQVSEALEFDLAHERLKLWITRKWQTYRPVIMTQHKKEELEYYD